MNQNAAPMLYAVVAASAALVVSLALGRSATQAVITAVIAAVAAYVMTVFRFKRDGRQ